MEIRNKLWEEIKSADINVRAILWYNNRHRTYNRLYDTFIAVVASAGALLYPIESKLPLISSIVIAMTSLVKAIFPQFIQSEKELTDFQIIMNLTKTTWKAYSINLTRGRLMRRALQTSYSKK